MKKSFAILLSAALFAGFTSCDNEQEDIFDETAAHRLNHALEEYQGYLSSAENGWVMEYFANNNEAGYPILMKFDAAGSVTMAGKNAVATGGKYMEQKSLYELIADNGPVLTFDTYNNILHAFSNPEDDPNTDNNEQGLGHEGDYEFVIYEATADYFHFKGKKYGLDIYMYKLPADMVWEEYYENIDAIRNEYFNSKVKQIWFEAAGERYTVTGMSTGLLSFVPEGGDPITETTTASFVVLLDGSVHFCKPFKGIKGSFAVQNFAVGEDGLLHCTDEGQDAKMYCDGPAVMFTTAGYTWRVNKDTMTGNFATAYEDLKVGALNASKSNPLQYIEYAYKSNDNKVYMTVKTSKRTFVYYLDVVTEGETVKLSYTDGNCDSNGAKFLKDCPEMTEYINIICKETLNLTGNSNMALTQITFANANGTFDADLR